MSQPKPAILDDPSLSLALRAGLRKHHLLWLMGENEWAPIVVGCKIALCTDPTKIDGIAPYLITKMDWKPGREMIELVSIGNQGTQRRILRLGSRYYGHHTQTAENPDAVIDAAVKANKTGE